MPEFSHASRVCRDLQLRGLSIRANCATHSGVRTTSNLRIGFGEDSHRTAPGGPLRLGGIDVPHDRQLVGHSDADVLLHAMTDALLGAAALPDIGRLFPNTESANRGRDSAEMLRRRRRESCRGRLSRREPRLRRPRRTAKTWPTTRTPSAIASPASCGLSPLQIGLKAKTGEGVGPVGREEVIEARCVALLEATGEASGPQLARLTIVRPTKSATSQSISTMSVSTRTKPAKEGSGTPHPTLRVYNTLSRQKEPFVTVRPGKVGIYLCGPTVYDKAHIGHMVGPVIFDCIKRYLTYCGYDVNWVVNITDVDDKLIKKANERGISMLDVAEENIADYNGNLTALGVDQIDHFPRATECMPEIIEFIEALIEQRARLRIRRRRLFRRRQRRRVRQALEPHRSNRCRATAARRRAQTPRRPTSHCGKSAKPGEPSWESPWGNGRPGWHIECSAMSKKLLGETFDIHGGGLDLVFPHHENEIAQSECCHGKPMVTYWAHNGLLRAGADAGKIGGRSRTRHRRAASAPAPPPTPSAAKCSRSKGAGGLADLIKRQGGERIRFFLLRTHYRSTVLFNEPAIEEAGIGLEVVLPPLQTLHTASPAKISTPSSRPPRAKPASPLQRPGTTPN